MDGVLAALLESLQGGPEAVTPELLEAFDAVRDSAIPRLMEMAAASLDSWAPINAIRVLGRLRAAAAIPVLVGILHGAEEDDAASAAAAHALVLIGPSVLSEIAGLLRSEQNHQGLGMALEVVSNLQAEYADDGRFDEVRRAMEERLVESDDEGLRSLLVAYIGDLASMESEEALLRALARPQLTQREYEAIRDVLEQLGMACPDIYFDSNGKGYPLDEEKLPLCSACGARMTIRESGELKHPAGACVPPPSLSGK